MDIKIAHNILKDVASKLEKMGVRYWIDGGTVLGLYRDGQLISYDRDMDFVIHYCDLDKINMDAFDNYDWYISKLKGKTISIDLFVDKIGINLFMAYDKGKKIECNGIKGGTHRIIFRCPKKYIENLSSVKLEGKSYPCPSDTDKYLTKKYGKWRIPQEKWSNDEDGFMYKIIRLNDGDKFELIPKPKG